MKTKISFAMMALTLAAFAGSFAAQADGYNNSRGPSQPYYNDGVQGQNAPPPGYYPDQQPGVMTPGPGYMPGGAVVGGGAFVAGGAVVGAPCGGPGGCVRPPCGVPGGCPPPVVPMPTPQISCRIVQEGPTWIIFTRNPITGEVFPITSVPAPLFR